MKNSPRGGFSSPKTLERRTRPVNTSVRIASTPRKRNLCLKTVAGNRHSLNRENARISTREIRATPILFHGRRALTLQVTAWKKREQGILVEGKKSARDVCTELWVIGRMPHAPPYEGRTQLKQMRRERYLSTIPAVNRIFVVVIRSTRYLDTSRRGEDSLNSSRN